MKRTNLMASLPLHAALFKDIAAFDRDLQSSLKLDLIRLERLSDTRGLSFMMIDMPDAGKVVDFALSRGHIRWTDLPKSFGKCNPYPKFLGMLFSRVFGEDGSLLPGCDVNHIYFLRQVLYLAKKVRKECSDAAILAEVIQFREIDQSLRSPSLRWDNDRLFDWPLSGSTGEDRSRGTRLALTDGYRATPDFVSHRDECPLPLLRIMQAVSDSVVCRFPEVDWRDIKPRHGPGAVADAKSGTDKYLFPTWPRKLDGFFPYSYFGQSREDLHLEVSTSMSIVEPPAKLLAVPKTLKAPRLIASEPIAHQYIQLGMMRWIRKHLPSPLRITIDFLDQLPSRAACHKASIQGDIATVDLSSASDRLSCWTVERVFRTNPSVLEALHACRTRWLRNATGVGEPYFLVLKKFAAMGSGTTFPVQSIVYALAGIAAILYEGNGKVSYDTITRAARRIRVFGDDIILPSHAVPSLALLLRHLQLKVNVMKTHYMGHFRESCGMDSYNGFDVTPLYLRDLELGQSAEDIVSWIDVSNNAYSKGLWHLSEAMLRTIPSETMALLPQSDEEMGCLSIRCYNPAPHKKVRYNRDLHYEETLGLVIQGGSLRRKRESHQNLLQYFVEEPSPEIIWSAGYDVRKRIRLRKRWVRAS